VSKVRPGRKKKKRMAAIWRICCGRKEAFLGQRIEEKIFHIGTPGRGCARKLDLRGRERRGYCKRIRHREKKHEIAWSGDASNSPFNRVMCNAER